ncbi:twin-arginine translocase TatA/TatE family subunit [Phenylobacterium parvum]|uniref:Sec-independent protein translocase protein TatA n=1 Tax=Phenylobacterium parvum TaxID=2201350 RepID=A0A2Z3I1M0_9CAUL|nr:twin-arginine translocase TatA/TatE family subunit [Phenylobacterium parvum]
MGGMSPVHWIIVAVVVLVLFGGRGKLSGLLGDAGKGIRAFREGLKDEGKPAPPADAAAKVEAPKEDARG